MMATRWSRPDTVAGFAHSAANPDLLRYAFQLRSAGASVAVDIGCGAARNLLPLAQQGWRIAGLDTSRPMLETAARRVQEDAAVGRRVTLVRARMDALPLRDRCADLIVAHGIWNLARSSAEFRRAVSEAARIARRGAAVFVFTFSRHTLSPSAEPVAGESFVFTDFSGDPQVFLTNAEFIDEMSRAGFDADPAVPIREYNRRTGMLTMQGGPPVIYEAAFRRRAGR